MFGAFDRLLRASLSELSILAQEAIDHLFCGFADDAAGSRVTLNHSRQEAAGLLKREVRWKRSNIRIGLDLKNYRPIA
jgi:hypothetical protein